MTWRLGLDVGTNSIGCAVITLDENERPVWLAHSGVRIFSDGRNPKDKQSLASTRREPRGARRNRDRYLKRRSEFMDCLIEHGLMPAEEKARKNLEKKDPWVLRVQGLDEKLSLHELGRALFHLQQRRGFKSNRKTDTGDDDRGKIKLAAMRVMERMKKEGARTLGELLAGPRFKDKKCATTTSVRARLNGVGAKAFYDFYPTRAMIHQEFEALWTRQKKFHGSNLTDAAHDALGDPNKGTLFFQRPLKPQPVGKCSLDPDEERAPKALPSVQRLRIYQEVNHLTVRKPGGSERKLTLEERDKIADKLLMVRKLSFDSMRTLIKQPGVRFSVESEKRKHLDGDKTAAILAGKNRWGPSWRDLPPDAQEQIVEPLLEEENEDTLINNLAEDHDLAPEVAEAVANAPLPDGHGRLGRRATGKLLAILERDVITYDEAVAVAGYGSHSMLDFDGEIFEYLPYYGKVLERHVAFGTGNPLDNQEKRFGKVANPTVHVALNQIRKVTNRLIRRYGAPAQIVIELSRDLPLSAEGKRDLENRQKKNRQANEKRAEELASYGQRNTYDNRMRLRLWEELNPHNPADRRCIYTGQQIGMARLFTDEVEIEHILPKSQTLDDSFSNKTLSLRKANRDKGQRSPFAAFGSSPDGYVWEDISERSANLPNSKAWRFGPDAMQRFEDKETGFLARQLNENSYIARLAKTYLQRTGADVWVTPGRLTHDLRWAWGLDSMLAGHNLEEAANPKKNRNDHRHHAIDAVVIALTDRALVQAVATAAARAEDRYDKNWLKDWPDPWPEFRNNVRDSVNSILVSHKADHGLQGELHEGTNYGMVNDPETGEPRLASRKALTSLTKGEIGRIGDLKIRDDILKLVAGQQDMDMKAALQSYASKTGVRRVRIHKVQSDYEIIRHNGHEKAVIPGKNHCVDLVETTDGAWHGVGVTRFEANRQKRLGEKTPLWKRQLPDAKHIMRVHKGDLLKLEKDGREQVMVVVRLSPSNDIFYLVAHTDAGDFQKRHDDKSDPFRWYFASFGKLKARKARLVHVDETGKLYDPGPPQ